MEGRISWYFPAGRFGCGLCCVAWKPAVNVMAAGRGSRRCLSVRHPNGMGELMGAIWRDRASNCSLSPVLA